MLLIDKQSNVPIYEQIVKQFETLIVSRVLKPDAMLPSVRKLSVELSINPNTLQKAYAELEERGICYSEAGRGRFVAGDAREILKQDKNKSIKRLQESVTRLALMDVSLEEIMNMVQNTFGKVMQN